MALTFLLATFTEAPAAFAKSPKGDFAVF
jgi:hypothetical protein